VAEVGEREVHALSIANRFAARINPRKAGRTASSTTNTLTATSTIEAPAARSRCHEVSRPIGALAAAIAADVSIIAGSRW
jgi:hypothetical protein